METTDQRGDVLSRQCGTCERSEARCWCLDCQEALCDGCESAHRRVTLTRSHRLLNQPPDDSGFISPTKFCKLHPSEPLKLFCLTCGQLTCRDCQLGLHKSHRFSFVSEAVESLKKQLDAYMQTVRGKMETATRSLQDMETRLKFLDHCERCLTEALNGLFKMLLLFLKQRIHGILREIQTAYGSEREMLSSRMLQVSQLQERHRSESEAAEKVRSKTELLALMTCIQQMKDLVDQDSSPPPNMTSLKFVTDRKSVESFCSWLHQEIKLQVSWIPFSVSERLMEKVATPPVSSSSSAAPPPTSCQPLTCTTTNSHVSPGPSCTAPSFTSSDCSSQSASSSRTSRSASHQCCPPSSSTPTVSNPHPGNVSQPASVSTSPSSSALASFCPSLSQTMNTCDLPGSASTSTFTTLVPPESSLSSPAPTDSAPSTATTTIITAPPASQTAPSQVNVPTLSTRPHQEGPSVSSLDAVTSSQSAISKSLQTPETKCPDSTVKINILTKSQVELGSGKFFRFRWKNGRPSRTSLSTSSSCGVKTTFVHRKKAKRVKANTSLSLQTSSSLSSSSISSSSSSHPASVEQVLPADPLPVQSSLVLLTSPQTSSSSPVLSSSISAVVQPVGSDLHQLPFSNNTEPVQRSLDQNQLPAHSQTRSSLVLLTNPQRDAPGSSSSIPARPSLSSFPSWILPQTVCSTDQHLTSILPPVTGPNPLQSAPVLNQQAVSSQNQRSEAERARSVSGSSALDDNSSLRSMETFQQSSAGSQVSQASLDPQDVLRNTTDNLSPVPQRCSASSNQQTLTEESYAESDSQVLPHQNHTCNSRPSPLHRQQQKLESDLVVDFNQSVQHQEVKEAEADKRTTAVSEPATAEFRETRAAEKLSSLIKDTAALSEETGPAEEQPSSQTYQVQQNISSSKEINLFVDLISPISSDDGNSLLSAEETEPAGTRSSPEEHGAERVKSEENKSGGRPFSPRLSEDELTVGLPQQAEPKMDQVSTKSDRIKLVGGSSPGSDASDDEPAAAVSEDEIALTQSSSETWDSENEELPITKTGPPVFSQPRWQPRVSLVRLPVNVPRRGRPLPSFHFILGEGREEIYLQESHVNVVSDDTTDEDTEDFTKLLSSPETPMSVEIISCSACESSSNASIICLDCGRGYHRDCHVPPVRPENWSEWICSLCQDLTDPSDPYSSDRPQCSQRPRLSLQDQRRCETLLLHLKVEGCSQFSGTDIWTDLMLASQRLTHHHPPPYQTAAHFVSDLWIILQDAPQNDAVKKLQQSFQKMVVEILGAELQPSLLMAQSANRSASDMLHNNEEEENAPPRSKLKELTKRLRDFMDLNQTPAAKRRKTS